jgi:hypothetical protein
MPRNLEPRYVLVKVAANMTSSALLTTILTAFDNDNNYKDVDKILALVIGNDAVTKMLDEADLEPLASDSYYGPSHS